MRFPYDNFPQGWSLTAGYGFGAPTDYGFHDGQDVNNLGGGNSDLGLPVYAIADGEVTSAHFHTTKPTFGNHIHILIKGAWGQRWTHHAHLSAVYVTVGQKVKEGQLIGRIGNSGTVYAHDHWAIKKQPTGIDNVARTREALQMWEDPVAFVNKWKGSVAPTPTPTPTPMPTDPNLQPMSTVYKDIHKAMTGKEMPDDTLAFRLNQGWNTIQVIEDYLKNDGEARARWGIGQAPQLTNFPIKQLAQAIVDKS